LDRYAFLTNNMPSSPITRNQQHKSASERIIVLALLSSFALLFFWLGSNGARPVSDAGGYVNMLRHFLASGHIDYMFWSQPTFIGIVALAAPWSLLFGTETASLQTLGIAYGLITLGGLYAFLVQDVRPTIAALLCASLLCFSEFLPYVPSFMTDVPYVAYTVWFLVVHRALETGYNHNRPIPDAVGFLEPALFISGTHPFFRIDTHALFGLQWLISRRHVNKTCKPEDSGLPGRHIFRQHSFFLSLALTVVAIFIVRLWAATLFR
jgi:hypothetical protein